MDRVTVVGFDDRARSHDALALGRLLTETTGARLIAAYSSLAPAAVGEGDLLSERMLADADRRLADAEALAGEPRPQLVTTSGRSPADGLLQLVEAQVAAGATVDAVVLGSSEHGAVGRVLIGSTPERLLQGAPCAVAIAPAGYAANAPQRLADVAVGYDGRPESEAALDAAAALAAEAGARLHAITVVAETPGVHVPGPLDAGEYVQYVATLHAHEAERARAAIERLGETPVELVLETPGGDATDVLTARSAEVDLVVLGSRGHGPLRRVLLGSVSTHLVRHSACPLLVVPRAAGDGS